MKDCPCGTGFPYTDCCGPLIRGVGYADTAEDLMRSRYTAFAFSHWDYLKNSLHPEERSHAGDLIERQKSIRWVRLEILETKMGGLFDKEGEVSFTAHFAQDNVMKTIKETSKFLKVDGQWFYSQRGSKTIPTEKAISKKPIQNKQPKVGRNDPCPCNSGKKFKKCCGK